MDRVRENDEVDDEEGVAVPLPLREPAFAPSEVEGVVDGGRDEAGEGDMV
jgi:hypothetical protein